MLLRAIFAIAAVAPAVFAQTPPPKYTFEVASVKRATDVARGGSTGMPPSLSGDPVRLNYREVTLWGLLARAYNVMPLQIEGPDWIRTELYNMSAKVPADAPKGHVPEMLQNFLGDRFHMVVHWDTTEEPGYALSVRTLPLKFKKRDEESDMPARKAVGMRPDGHMEFKAHTLDDLANALAPFMGKPIVNLTGVEGHYDIVIDAAPDSMPGFGFPGAAQDSPLPAIITALRELGLNLQARRVPVKRLIVDSADKIPTEN